MFLKSDQVVDNIARIYGHVAVSAVIITTKINAAQFYALKSCKHRKLQCTEQNGLSIRKIRIRLGNIEPVCFVIKYLRLQLISVQSVCELAKLVRICIQSHTAHLWIRYHAIKFQAVVGIVILEAILLVLRMILHKEDIKLYAGVKKRFVQGNINTLSILFPDRLQRGSAAAYHRFSANVPVFPFRHVPLVHKGSDRLVISTFPGKLTQHSDIIARKSLL